MTQNPFKSLPNFRLGYPVTKAYPWPYTTSITFLLFTGLTVFFILINIPLTAYEIHTVDSSNPNSTQNLDPPMFFNLLPSSLQPSPGDFSPQQIYLGNVISTNMSIFNYQVTDMVRDNQNQVSIPWSNNALASCNVNWMSLDKGPETWDSVTLRASLNCWDPFLFAMVLYLDGSWNDMPILTLTRQSTLSLVIRTLLDIASRDLTDIWQEQRPSLQRESGKGDPVTLSNLTLKVTPCCECRIGEQTYASLDGQGETFVIGGTEYFNSHPSCNSTVPTKLSTVSISAQKQGTDGWSRVIRSNGLPDATGSLDFLAAAPLLNVSAELKRSLHNVFQLFYHAIHTDLGVYTPNSIFNSSDIYNRTILAGNKTVSPDTNYTGLLVLPKGLDWDAWPLDSSFSDWGHNPSQLGRTIMTRIWDQLINGTETSEMSLRELKTWAKVPRLSYVTPIFRMKSSASAAASVFVASFAMISASWKAWNLILTLLAGSRPDNPEEADCKLCNCPKCSWMFARLPALRRSLEDEEDVPYQNKYTSIFRPTMSQPNLTSTIPFSRTTSYRYKPVTSDLKT